MEYGKIAGLKQCEQIVFSYRPQEQKTIQSGLSGLVVGSCCLVNTVNVSAAINETMLTAPQDKQPNTTVTSMICCEAFRCVFLLLSVNNEQLQQQAACSTGNWCSTKRPCWRLCPTVGTAMLCANCYHQHAKVIRVTRLMFDSNSYFPRSPKASFTGRMAQVEKLRDDKVHPLGEINVCTKRNHCSSKGYFPHYNHTHTHTGTTSVCEIWHHTWNISFHLTK